jgi:hypothetical protein
VLRLPWNPNTLAFGARFLPHWSQAPELGVALFAFLAVSLFVSARKRLQS